ncbi:MAG: winged helix DNA-binding domain-containing protein, partial [Nocardioides sp.]
MRLTRRRLNRTLLDRQHLLTRANVAVPEMVTHLVGLQAQETLPPYLSLAARLTDLDPEDVSGALEDRSLVRLLTMRGTIHLLTAEDALALRQWTQPCQDRERRSSQNTKAALHLDTDPFNRAVRRALADGPLPVKALGEALAATFPDVPANALSQLARVNQPLAQLPPRGTWKQSGGVVYQYVDRWVGRPLSEPDPPTLVHRYLRAFGPASAADVTAWSGLTGMAGLLKTMDDMEVHEDPAGRRLFDVAGGALADEEVPAPVRLLGTYDNVWLSHAGRDRVTEPEKRKRWMGVNGGVGSALFVDGMLEGLWRPVDAHVEVLELFRTLTRQERAELDEETARVEALL